MIQKVREEIPDLSIEQLCHLFTVSRSWYYEHVAKPDEDEEETALRDRIEEIILEFSGYNEHQTENVPSWNSKDRRQDTEEEEFSTCRSAPLETRTWKSQPLGSGA